MVSIMKRPQNESVNLNKLKQQFINIQQKYNEQVEEQESK